MTDLYDLGATPQDFENTYNMQNTDKNRCGICSHFEPNFHTCNHPKVNRCVNQNDLCDLFCEDKGA